MRFDRGSLAMYANDSSNFRQVPIGVVVPRTLDDVVATMRACHRYGAPVLSRGGGTSLSGETVNNAVVIDFSKYLTGIDDVDPAARQVTAETGVINEQLNKVTGEHGLVFGPDPSSHSRCTIGGNIGNNSCGIHSVQARHYGPGPRTSDNTHALEVVTYDGERFWVGVDEEERLDEIIAAGGRKGEIYAKLRDLRDRYADEIRDGFPSVDILPRRVSGYNLDELLPEKGFNVARALVGTEGTCAIALRAVLLLTPGMYQRTTVLVQYPGLAEAASHVTEIMAWQPIGLEALDERLIEEQQLKHLNVKGLHELPRRDEGGAWLMVQFGADTADESVSRCEEFVSWLLNRKGYAEDRIAVAKSAQEGGNSEDLWAIRESGLGSTAFPPDGDHWPGWEDSAVPPDRVGDYVRDLKALYAKHGLVGAMYGHLGEGCIHSRISFDLRSADGSAHLPGVHGGGRRPRHALRRHPLRGARRRTAARRAAGEAVRPPAHDGHAGVQGHLGPGREDEPRQGRRRLPARREPQARRRLQPVAARRAVRLRRGRRGLRARRAALRGRRQVPGPRADPDHVPQLPGDPRGEAHDAGPRRGCCSRCCAGRSSPTAGSRRRSPKASSSAWPARAAPATARWTSTCPPTRPSSATTTTGRGGAGGRATPTRSASSTRCRGSWPTCPSWSTR